MQSYEQQYISLMKEILSNGEEKSPSREGLPGTRSIFGAQFKFDLAEGFPILTTKQVSFKNIAVELIWFLRGDTNIKYLIDNGVHIWDEDAYNYYCKIFKISGRDSENIMTFKTFIDLISKNDVFSETCLNGTYHLGDCGWQYGKLWRDWEYSKSEYDKGRTVTDYNKIDQISNLIESLLSQPESRRHIITALNPEHYDDLALFPCHVLAQFNCRKLSATQREPIYGIAKGLDLEDLTSHFFHYNDEDIHKECDEIGLPKYKLDCHMYQRSADLALGVPYNTASYALITHILCEICNMVPGNLIHSFGDVHLYDNHIELAKEQILQPQYELPKLIFSDSFKNHIIQWRKDDVFTTSEMISSLDPKWFSLIGYINNRRINYPLNTGMNN